MSDAASQPAEALANENVVEKRCPGRPKKETARLRVRVEMVVFFFSFFSLSVSASNHHSLL
jgi:hypothetical protein